MVTWIVIAVFVLALLVLVCCVAAVVGRLTGLRRAVRRVQLREEQAQGLQPRAASMQTAIEALRERAESAAQQVEVIRAGRGHAEPQPSYLDR